MLANGERAKGIALGQGFGEDHDVSGIAGDLDGARRFEPGSLPLRCEVQVSFVRPRDDAEAAVSRMVLRQHSDHVDHG